MPNSSRYRCSAEKCSAAPCCSACCYKSVSPSRPTSSKPISRKRRCSQKKAPNVKREANHPKTPFRSLCSPSEVNRKIQRKTSTKWSVENSFDYRTIENDLIYFKESLRDVSRFYKPVDLDSFKRIYKTHFNSIDFDDAFKSLMTKINEEMVKKNISNKFKGYYVKLEEYLCSLNKRLVKPLTEDHGYTWRVLYLAASNKSKSKVLTVVLSSLTC
ncbi:hypothetical protein GEMRC1_005244 [Eukaryota sp. GEM-RC1]